MNKTIRTILSAAVFIALAVSCHNGIDGTEPVDKAGKSIEISINGLMGEYTQADDTKASLVNNIRVSWEGGETVYVFDGTECLGSLKASISGDDRYALLSTDATHTVATPAEGTTKLTLVYSPLLNENEAPEVINGNLSIPLSVQNGGKAPFVAYATLDYKGVNSITDQVVAFKFATSVIRVNCTGLSPNTAISSATLSDVNTVCKLTLSGTAAPTVSGDVNGTITRTGDAYFPAEKVNSEGEAVFQIAVPVLSAGTRELALLQETGKYEDNNFSQNALAAATSVNTVCQLVIWKGTVTFDVQGHSTAPVPITGLNYESMISAPATPLADCFKFSGWFKEADCINAWDFAADKVTEDITLYAKWVSVLPAGILIGKFTVDATGRQVYFSRGDMLHNFTDKTDYGKIMFRIEDLQHHTLPTKDSSWNEKHENHFHWSSYYSKSINDVYQGRNYEEIGDVLFTNETENSPKVSENVGKKQLIPIIRVDSLDLKSVWRVLSAKEWNYLLYERTMTYGKKRWTNQIRGVFIGDKVLGRRIHRGIFIYPDDYNSDTVSNETAFTWERIEEAGIVFLPAAGVRHYSATYGPQVRGLNTEETSWYWTSTSHETDSAKAYGVKFDLLEGPVVEAQPRGVGSAVRLVRDCN